MKGKRINWFLIGLCFFLAAAIVTVFSFVGQRAETATTFSMGSYVQQTVYGRNRKEGTRQAAKEIAALENLISWRIEGSDVARINEAAGNQFISIDSRTEQVLSAALSVCEESGGAFDVTIAPVSWLWDFDGNPHLPDAGLIETFRKKINYAALSVPGDGTAALQARDMALDLGAVGKGAACDAAVAAYEKAGVGQAIVAVGGSVGVYGKKPFGRPWTVAVRDPGGEGALGTLEVREGFVSTSGSYEKSFIQDGKAYHHLLDPKTGYPADSGLVSVTVKSGSGALSDALSTACFVLGLEKSLPLLERFDAGGLFVTEENKIYAVGELQKCFSLSSPDYTLEELE